MRKGGLTCRFYCDGKMLTEKHWHVAPSTDDRVMLKKRQPINGDPDPKLYPYKVAGRIFMGEGAAHNCQMIYLYVERDGWEDENA